MLAIFETWLTLRGTPVQAPIFQKSDPSNQNERTAVTREDSSTTYGTGNILRTSGFTTRDASLPWNTDVPASWLENEIDPTFGYPFLWSSVVGDHSQNTIKTENHLHSNPNQKNLQIDPHNLRQLGSAKDAANPNLTHDICSDRLSLPKTCPEDLEIAASEVQGRLSIISDQTFNIIKSFYQKESALDDPFMSKELFSAFIELYIEYFDSFLPFIHRSRLVSEDSPWILLLATATVGSHFSGIKNIVAYTEVLTEFLERVLRPMVSHPSMFLPLLTCPRYLL